MDRIESDVARKFLSVKYRDAYVGHCNLPVLAGIAPDKLSSQVCSKVHDV
ncbi:MAG TPA: hypothetical protein VKR55_18750 [Bradyrhizobium sp.]|nr:hypothetical protein [Bradyrhizobium sp.]HLZ04172.1 hypothetical protein [Bradyrhizobium sp.]